MENELKLFLDEIKDLRKTLKTETVPRVAKKALLKKANELGTQWLSDLSSKLRPSLTEEVSNKYDDAFTRLIKLSSPNNLRSSYLLVLTEIIRSFRDDLVIPSKQGIFLVQSKNIFDGFFSSLSNKDENDYLQEAIACAKADHFRAAAVLGWSAAVDRIHRKLEKIGFQKFNQASAEMARLQNGRYKKFNQSQNINSLSELREVFDTLVLWIIEYMQLIDSNQHTRLKSCFDIRCQSAHPGDAPITSYNLLSFFSDLDLIVLNNEKFQL